MMRPNTFGKFRVLRKLPGGAMGAVYEAFDTAANREVALKLIDHGTDPDSLEILAAERRGAALHERLSQLDERICRIYEYGDHDNFFYIAMEFIEGHDLAELLAGDGVGPPFAARIAADICQALEQAHHFRYRVDGEEYRGVVHGDIKPRNIRITTAGAVRLLDFGIAKALSETRKQTRNLFGSIQYSSPERLKTGDVDASSDLWAVAVVLYETLARKPYFQGGNPAKTEHAIRNYTALRPMPDNAPPALQAILARSLAPDPAERYPTAGEFRDDLVAYLEDRPIAALEPDLAATRRTAVADAGDSAETRRTSPPPAEFPDEATRRTSRPAPPKKRQLSPKWRPVRRAALAACVLLALLLAWHEISLAREAGRLRAALRSEQLKDLGEAWNQYSALAQSSYFPFMLRTARTALLDKMLERADATIHAYRHSDAVRESDWIVARDVAARALHLVPGDRDVTARVRLSQGHVNRIRGAITGNAKLSAVAREQLEEASRLMPRSPDPYLGLARLYVYNLRDVDAAEEALRQAGKRGFELGERETGHLADGHRYRGDQFLREADKAQSAREEKEYLERAKKAYQRSQDLYSSIVPHGESPGRLREVREELALVDVRMEAAEREVSWR